MGMGEKKSIGILGGMGPLATADLFQKIVQLTQAATDRDHIRIYIDDHAQIPDRTAAILDGGEDPLPYMEESVRKLTGCGADCIIMPCNTAHFFLPALRKKAPVPILSMLTATEEAAKRAFEGKTAAILATRGTLAAKLYQTEFEKAGLSFLVPDETEQEKLMRVIYDGVKAGAPPTAYEEDLNAVLSSLTEKGTDFFVLGCTELPIAAKTLQETPPCIDPTEELAKYAIRFSGYIVKEY